MASQGRIPRRIEVWIEVWFYIHSAARAPSELTVEVSWCACALGAEKPAACSLVLCHACAALCIVLLAGKAVALVLAGVNTIASACDGGPVPEVLYVCPQLASQLCGLK